MPRKKTTPDAKTANDPIEVAARNAYESRRQVAETLGDATDVTWSEADESARSDATAAVRALKDDPDATPEEFHALVGEGEHRDLSPEDMRKEDAFYRAARASLGMDGPQDAGMEDPTPTVTQAQARQDLTATIKPPHTVEMANGVTEVVASSVSPAASVASAAGETDPVVDDQKEDLAGQMGADVDGAAVALDRVLLAIGVTKPDDAILSIATMKAGYERGKQVDPLQERLTAATNVLDSISDALNIGDGSNPLDAIARLRREAHDIEDAQGEPEHDGRKDRSMTSQWANLPPCAMRLALNASARAQGIGAGYRSTPSSERVGDTEWSVSNDGNEITLTAETGGSRWHQAAHNANALRTDVAAAVQREGQTHAALLHRHAAAQGPERAVAMEGPIADAKENHDVAKAHLKTLESELAKAEKAAQSRDVKTYVFPATLWEDESWH